MHQPAVIGGSDEQMNHQDIKKAPYETKEEDRGKGKVTFLVMFFSLLHAHVYHGHESQWLKPFSAILTIQIKALKLKLAFSHQEIKTYF